MNSFFPKNRVTKGEEKLTRLIADGRIRLDAMIFQSLWENRSMIPKDWKKHDAKGNIRYFFFDGTILRDSRGSRYVLFLYWRDGRWDWGKGWLDCNWTSNEPSVLIAIAQN